MSNQNLSNHSREQLIFLVGFMGTGKTHWGKLWAKKLGYAFIDLDAMIESGEHSTVAEIFATKGETYFRTLEARLLRRLKGKEKTIIACGGGTVCFSGNLEWMKDHGTIVWLKAGSDFIIENIKKQEGTRPLLMNMSDEEMKTFIETKLIERESFYEQAGIILNAEEVSGDSLDLWLR